jgi:predicted dehydrogenase
LIAKPLKIGIIGFGSIAKKHLAEIKAYRPDTKIIIRTRQNIDEADRPSNVIITAAISDIISQHFDLIIIATPASEHSDDIAALSKCANTLVVEKPIAATAKEGFIIAQAEVTSRKPIWVAYNLRYLEGLPVLQNILASGKIGKLRDFSMTVGQDLKTWRPGSDYKTSASAQASLGGGVVRELSHELDLAIYLFTDAQDCTLKRSQRKYHSLDVEDTAHIKGKFQNGQINGTITLDFTREKPERTLIINGDLGTIKWSLIKGELKISTNTTTKTVFTKSDDLKSTYQRMWKDLLDSNEPLLPKAEEGLKLIQWIEDMEVCSEMSTGL